MRPAIIPRVALFLAGLAFLSGCSNSQLPPEKTVIKQNQNTIRFTLNDPKMSPQTKQAMIESMKQNMPAGVKAAMGKQEATAAQQHNANIERINANPNLSAEDKQRFIEQERARQ